MPVEAVYADRFHLLEPFETMDFSNPAAREAFAKYDAPLNAYVSPPVVVTNRTIPGPQGEIPVRLYWPEGHSPATDARPGLVWFHGGAFIFGDLDMNEADVTGREIAARAGAVVMSVDYRLCTAERFMPAPQIDAVAATEWFDSHRAELGVREGIFVGGASAGACLAAGVGMKLLELGDRCIAGLMPIYPVIYSEPPQRSEELGEKCAVVPPALIFDDDWARKLNRDVLGRPIEEAEPWEFPGVAATYSGLPPVLIVNAEYDSLRQHGENWADELQRDGVDVTCVTELGQLHGHLNRIPQDCSGTVLTYDRMVTFMKEH